MALSRQSNEIGFKTDQARWIARRYLAAHPSKQSCLPFDHVNKRVTQLPVPVDHEQEQAGQSNGSKLVPPQ